MQFKHAAYLIAQTPVYLLRLLSRSLLNKYTKNQKLYVVRMGIQILFGNQTVGLLAGSRYYVGYKDAQRPKSFFVHGKNLFVEVMYKNDSVDREFEKLEIFNSLQHLNQYLEKEFRASF